MKNSKTIKQITMGIFTILLLHLNASAQIVGAKQTKLIDLYVLGKYEDCLLKATKLSEKEKYRKQSEPYIWISLSLIACMKDAELEQYYPESATIKKAIKMAVKFKKIDDKARKKKEDYLYDENISFIYELMNLGLIEGGVYLDAKNYAKASYFYKMVAKLDPQNKECELLNGVILLYNKNKEGQVSIDSAMVFFEQAAKQGGYTPDSETERAFNQGFISYTNYLISKGKKPEAIEVITTALKLDPSNTNFTQLKTDISSK